MNLHQTVASFFPRSLLLILASSLPVALSCNYLAQARDAHPAADTMTPAAVAARLAPVAHVLSAATDTTIASAYPAVSKSN